MHEAEVSEFEAWLEAKGWNRDYEEPLKFSKSFVKDREYTAIIKKCLDFTQGCWFANDGKDGSHVGV